MGPPSSRAATRLRWPMMFKLEACDSSLLDTAAHELAVERDYRAAPEVVHKSFVAFVGDPPWSPGFVGVDWWTPEGELDGAVIDELYMFMAMRVRVLEHTPGRRSLAYVERWSMPLARRMIQLILTDPLPEGGTRLRYRVAFDPPSLARPFVRPVQAAFRRWFEASLDGLGKMLERTA